MSNSTILVTGFKPFGCHATNASWEAVSRLEEAHFSGHHLVKHEVPVVYKYVDEHIPHLWTALQPQLVLHVGVSSETNVLKLETLARRKSYRRQDAEGNWHPTQEASPPDEGSDVYHTPLDIDAIINELQTDQLRFSKSNDAGLFLCEYTYYKSLHIDFRRCLFVHVPPLGKPYTADELAKGLTAIIHALLRRL